MPRLLFTCHDAGGTVPPVLAVAKALLARGHDVTILSQPSVEARAVGIGCGFRTFSDTPDYRRDAVLEEQLDRTIPSLVGASVGRDLVAAASETNAEALVVDPNLAGALAAAETLPLPCTVLLHSLFRTFVDTWFGELWPLLAQPINDTRREFDLDEVTSWAEMLARHDLIVSPVPEVFDAPVRVAPQALRHVGFLVPSDAAGVAIELPRGSEPLVVVSFSTTYQRQEEAISRTLEALAGEDVRVVATTSGHAGRVDPPPNAVLANFVPHVPLFAVADVVVTHGGLGTTAAALQAGVPLVCMPMGRDQPLNAARVSELGAGIVCDADVGDEALRSAVRELLSSADYAAAAARIGQSSRDAGEGDAAAVAIEDLLAR